MKESKHHLVTDLKIGLVFFLLVVSVFIFVSYGAISHGKPQMPNQGRYGICTG